MGFFRAARPLRLGFIVALTAGLLWHTATGSAQGERRLHPVVSAATRTDISQPVRTLPTRPPTPAVLGEIFERPFKLLPNREGSLDVDTVDPVVQAPAGGPAAPAVEGSFEGVNNVNGVLPPDPTGAIGPNHYVQMVNLSFAIYDRAGQKLYGPVNNNTLWTGFGGPCETRNDGDPVVLYDHLADRWVMSQFALPNIRRGPFYQCIAVSQTPDPLGAWYRYEFTISTSKLNDYPKFGLWPDGYYMTTNQFKCSFITCNWAGQGVVAFERDKMLLGQIPKMVYFDLETLDPNLGGMLPADLDGPPPPAGAPNLFVQVDDDAWGYSPDQLQVWRFHVDWNNTASSTFTHALNLPTASFNANMCNYARNCIPQPGGTNVDAISDRLMYRLQYRNFGNYQTLVANHTVDVDGTDHAGLRWYELRDGGSGWTIYQQGTFAPDNHHRWMGSVAMNGVGDIAAGYSKSSGTFYPSVMATGRLDGDPAGAMTQGEVTIVAGGGYQTHSSGRWGDYSELTVDPKDDCTFWYTQEYYASVGSASWRTRIGSVKLRDCGSSSTGGDTTNPTVSISSPTDGATVSSTIDVTASANDNVGVEKVDFYLDGVLQSSGSTSGNGSWTWSWDTATASSGDHTLQAKASDAANNEGSSAIVNVVVDNADPTVSITSPTGGSVSATVNVVASASDDVAVTKVEFYLDGNLKSTDTTETYSWSWNTTTAANGNHTLSAKAYDAAGHVTTSASVTVNVDNVTSGINLTANGYKVKGLQKADLSWDGVDVNTSVDVFRDGTKLTTTGATSYTDNIDNRGGGSYTYRVCQAGTTTCSNDVPVTF